MCIVLLTTAHPKYAVVILDNRDEYILRPTSRPHWWTAQSETNPSLSVQVLSSRDLQREEQGTWLGITKGGNFAVLTNYRETNIHDASHPVAGKRSRGGMVTAWLGADPSETTSQFVTRMLQNDGVKGVGGFSLICGKLRKSPHQKSIEPLAIISNRADHINQVPWIGGTRGKTYGLSNAIYMEPGSLPTTEEIWPKVQIGADMLSETVTTNGVDQVPEDQFIKSLYKILDTDNFPLKHDMDLEEGIPFLKDSIFIPAFGGKQHQDEMAVARSRGATPGTGTPVNGIPATVKPSGEVAAAETLTIAARPGDSSPPINGFQTGLYGTQRQTVILVDWEGNVTYKERALWDENGIAIERGEADMEFRFGIDGWDEATKVNGNGNVRANGSKV